MNKKRLLIITSEFPPQPGGIGNHAFNLAKHLDKNGYTIELISDNRSDSGEEEKLFDSNLKFKVFRVIKHKLRLWMYIKRLLLLFQRINNSDSVIASGKFSLWSVAFASVFYKRKYIAVIHGSEVNFTNKVLRTSITYSLKRFSKLIAVSKYTKALVTAIHHNVVCIPNGIDIEQLQSKTIQKTELSGHPKLITVGNVTERKGQLNVIKHLPELLKEYPDLQYHCVGIPTQKEVFSNEAKVLNVNEHITFHGRVSDDILQSLLLSSDIFVMLSSLTQTGDVEGFGIALIEANYFGLPAIGAKGCGIEDAIDDTKSGRLIAFDAIDEFKLAIKDILANYDTYKKHAKDWSLQHSWELIIKRYIKEL